MFELTGRASIAPKLAVAAFLALAAAGCAKNPADDASLGLGAGGRGGYGCRLRQWQRWRSRAPVMPRPEARRTLL